MYYWRSCYMSNCCSTYPQQDMRPFRGLLKSFNKNYYNSNKLYHNLPSKIFFEVFVTPIELCGICSWSERLMKAQLSSNLNPLRDVWEVMTWGNMISSSLGYTLLIRISCLHMDELSHSITFNVNKCHQNVTGSICIFEICFVPEFTGSFSKQHTSCSATSNFGVISQTIFTLTIKYCTFFSIWIF